MSEISIESLARELGLKTSEILDFEEAPAGLVVKTSDGNTLIRVPEDSPDIEGKTGWMFLAVPAMKVGKTYHGFFPVFAQEVDDDVDQVAAEGYPADGSIPAVLAWVAGDGARAQVALDAESASKKPRSTLIEELEAILAQAPETGDAADFERLGIDVPDGHTGELRDDGTAVVLDSDGNVVAEYDADGNLIEPV